MGKKKAGHRSWGAGGQKVPGKHVGDFLAPATRSRVMASIKGTDTGPEKIIKALLEEHGLAYESHRKDLPGRPDFVLPRHGIILFVDGDFWHGFRFPLWRHKLSEKWQQKIEATRIRDRRNHARLRRLGWRVLRIWEHQLENAVEASKLRILKIIVPESTD